MTGSRVRQVRESGYVPGIVYSQGEDAQPLKFKEFEFIKIMRAGAGSQLIELQGLDEGSVFALMRELQRHPVRRSVVHVDFYRVQMDQVVRTEVPLLLEGESEAMRGGAILIHPVDRIEVECLPRAIPDHFVVDLSLLVGIDDSIKVSDLAEVEDVMIVNSPDDVVASLTLPRILIEEEEEEEVEELEEGIEPEVISKGREEEEEE
ncbi:MAG: 50S ribosomal protein L25 [Chloroflexi bacterium]|nr:50S ribosomal protein L25 [Chloroflexota bacterium]